MPKMDGIEFYQRMKEIDKKVKVCFITASEIHYYEKITKEVFVTLGVRCLIRKPIKIEDLIKDLKQELEFVKDINNNDHNNYNRVILVLNLTLGSKRYSFNLYLFKHICMKGA